jgi:hypothetical protein
VVAVVVGGGGAAGGGADGGGADLPYWKEVGHVGDYSGNDVFTLNDESESTCKEKCKSMDNCQGVSFTMSKNIF